MTIAQKTGSDPVIEPDPVQSGVCTYPENYSQNGSKSERPPFGQNGPKN